MYKSTPRAVRAPTGTRLRLNVALWLDLPDRQRSLDLDGDDIAQLRCLAAAALHDVAGLSRAAVEEWIEVENAIRVERRLELMAGVSDSHFVDRRQLNRRIATGRQLWVALAAWPWWPICDALGDDALKGGLPERWWEIERVTETFELWQRLRGDGRLDSAA